MHKNILIIGNGFDLDLGLKTKYSDFADSPFWPDQDGVIIPHLKNFLETKRNTESWFDIEGELLNYARKDQATDKSLREFASYNPQRDIDYFVKIQNSLCSYIKEQQTKQLNKTSIAEKVLKSILDNGYFNVIYSFNYTDLGSLAKRLKINTKIDNIQYIHGKVADNSIILGVDETPLLPGYELFHKTMSPYYRSHDIFNDLSTADEIVVFGLSFGCIDYTYFDRFFQSQSGREPVEDKKKKHITLFTKDENSRIDIMKRFGELGINRQNLYTQSKFQIIRTTDVNDQKLIDEFCVRLKRNSKSAHNAELQIISSML